jgi:hypothetical protein
MYLGAGGRSLLIGGDRCPDTPIVRGGTMSRPADDTLNPVVVISEEMARGPEEIHRLNDVLAGSGLGRALGEVVATTSFGTIVSVTGDPRAACEVLDRERSANNADACAVALDHRMDAGTDDSTLTHVDVFSFGKIFGHGEVGWSAITELNEVPGKPQWSPPPSQPGRRHVVALLDSYIDPTHEWLRGTTEDPILIDAEKMAGEPWKPVSLPPHVDPTTEKEIGTHSVHGTFIAGLIRTGAPHARLLSVRVMNDRGVGSEVDVLGALQWLDRHRHSNPVDVVLLALGREEGQSESAFDRCLREKIGEQIRALARNGVRVVISAGNCDKMAPDDKKRVKTYPAAYAADHSLVVSVGSGPEHNPDAFSKRGDWVEQWAAGKDAVSIVPYQLRQEDVHPGFVRWSGTSFSAARRAAELADELWQPTGTPDP